jgi:hypothetical protein
LTKYETIYPQSALRVVKMILTLVDSMGHKHLELLDGAGNTLLHYAARQKPQEVFDLLLACRPDLICRENAYGCTPAELAEQEWIKAAIKPPSIAQGYSSQGYGRDVRCSAADNPPATFIEDVSGATRRTLNSKWETKEMCDKVAKAHTEARRKLVTLFEVSEVASTTYTTYRKSQQPYRQKDEDEVSWWLRR